MSREGLLNKLKMAIVDGDKQTTCAVAHEVLEAGIDPVEAILEASTKGLDIIGERFQNGDAFLPDLVRAGDAMKACADILKPSIKPERIKEVKQGNVVIGTVFGDIHDIGKNLVATMLTSSGFDVYDLGINVSVRGFIDKAKEVNAKVIALSALLTYTANYQRMVIQYLKDAGMRDQYYVVVGGAPVSPESASEIGADGYARTAIGAAELFKRLLMEGGPPPLSKTLIVDK